MATGTGEERRSRSWPSFAAAFAAIVALPLVLYLPDGGLQEFYDCTIGFQFGRDSVFSLWGLHPSLGWLQDVVKVAGLVFAGALAFVPRRRDLRQVAGARRRGADRGAAGREPLVLLLHPVVHPVRAAGDVRGLPRPRARASVAEPRRRTRSGSRPPSKGRRPRADMGSRPQVPRSPRRLDPDRPDHPDRHLDRGGDNAAEAQRTSSHGGAGLHPDRAPRRNSHHRNPGRHRAAGVPRPASEGPGREREVERSQHGLGARVLLRRLEQLRELRLEPGRGGLGNRHRHGHATR